METYDYINQVNASVVDLQGYVDHTLPLSLLCITMILRVRRNFFEITTKPNRFLGNELWKQVLEQKFVIKPRRE